MNHAIEIVTCAPKESVSQEEFELASKSITDVLKTYQGFISRSFARKEDGSYVDIILWGDMESAKRAAQNVASDKVCLDFFSLIDESKTEMSHAEVI